MGVPATVVARLRAEIKEERRRRRQDRAWMRHWRHLLEPLQNSEFITVQRLVAVLRLEMKRALAGSTVRLGRVYGPPKLEGTDGSA